MVCTFTVTLTNFTSVSLKGSYFKYVEDREENASGDVFCFTLYLFVCVFLTTFHMRMTPGWQKPVYSVNIMSNHK